MSSTKEDDEDLQIVRRAVDGLAEHFDTVQVFCTRHSGERDGTINLKVGAGNWFARYGQVSQWLACQDQCARNEAAKD